MPSTMKTTAPCVQTGRQHPIHMHTVSPFFFFLLTVYLPAHRPYAPPLDTYNAPPLTCDSRDRDAVGRGRSRSRSPVACSNDYKSPYRCRFPAARWPPHCAHPLCCAVRRQWPPPASSVLTPMRQHWEVSIFIFLQLRNSWFLHRLGYLVGRPHLQASEWSGNLVGRPHL